MPAGCSNVNVYHFDGWAKANRVVRRSPSGTEPTETNQSPGARFKKHLRDGYGDSRSFDAVLVDEAQDFDRTWFECVLEAMKAPDDGDQVIGRQGPDHPRIQGVATPGGDRALGRPPA